MQNRQLLGKMPIVNSSGSLTHSLKMQSVGPSPLRFAHFGLVPRHSVKDGPTFLRGSTNLMAVGRRLAVSGTDSRVASAAEIAIICMAPPLGHLIMLLPERRAPNEIGDKHPLYC